MAESADHFSSAWSPREGYEGADRAATYIRFRPKTPQQIIDRIIGYVKEKIDGELDLGLDFGCGSGQCTDLLAPHFKRILGTDISVAQIETAKSLTHPSNITFEVAPCDNCPVESGTAQLLNVAVAVQWFDLPSFFKETDRVLCSNGVVSLFGYGPYVAFQHEQADVMLQALKTFHSVRLKGYWAPGITVVERGYADIILPYEDHVREDIWDDEEMSLFHFAGYLSSGCGFQNYCKEKGEEAGQALLDEFMDTCKKAMGYEGVPSENVPLKFKRKYSLLMGRKP